ncbi:hypothetical protein AHAS_Ahas10G0143500 [Arachis hypogaea]
MVAITLSTSSTLRAATILSTLKAATILSTLRAATTLSTLSPYLLFKLVMIGLNFSSAVMEINSYSIGPMLVWVGPTSDYTSGGVSCDSGFPQPQRAYTVVHEYDPSASALTEGGGLAAPTEADGSAAPSVDDLVSGHPYNLWTERNPPDRYTPLQFGQGMMGKGLNWLARKK